jgi:gluconate kinase
MDAKVDLETFNPALFDGWMPMRVLWPQRRARVEWCYAGDVRPIDPFFDQTVEECLRRPFNLLFRRQTPIEMLGRLHEARPGLEPTAFIFHMSRCGSTLISQMLAALPQNIVISESGPIYSVLEAWRTDAGVTDDTRLEWLRWIVSALGRRQTGDEEHYFIKFDAWNTVDLPLIQRAFPLVPWIFVYRDPVEVLVSHLNRRGARMFPGVVEPQMLNLTADSAMQMPPERYDAVVLQAICRAALENQTGRCRFINYRQLPSAFFSSVLDFFRVNYTSTELERMRHAAQFHAKYPSMNFVDDTEAKRLQATDAVRRAADELLSPLYEQLEAARRAQEQSAPAEEKPGECF